MRCPKSNAVVGGAAALVCLLLAVAVPPAGAASGSPPAHTLAQVREGVEASRARLRSLLVVYESDGRAFGESEAAYSRHTLAALGKFRMTDNIHWTTRIPTDLDLNHHQLYYDGDSLDVYYPRLGYYETSRVNAHRVFALKARTPVYLECFGWWPPDDEKPPHQVEGRPFYLHEALAVEGYRALPAPERVGGAWCQVVELPGLDKMWLDATRGFVLLRRECRSSRAGLLEAEYTLSDYREASPGVWIPWDVQRTLYDVSRAGPGEPTPVLSVAHARVLRAEVNRLDKGVFRFEPTPGLLVHDYDEDRMEQVPGGLAFLDEVVGMAARLSVINAPPGRATVGTMTSRPWVGYALIALIVGLVPLDLYLLFERLGGRRAAREAVRRCGLPRA